jgi:hypothetical protein
VAVCATFLGPLVAAPPAGAAPALPIVRVAESKTGGAAGGGTLFLGMEASDDGRYVTFSASSQTFTGGSGWENIYLRDAELRANEQISLTTSGGQPNSFSSEPSISADGRYVAYDSRATNIGLGDTHDAHDVYVLDRTLGTTRWLSYPRAAGERDTNWKAKISGSGRYVFFETSSDEILGPFNGTCGCEGGLARYDLQTDTVIRADSGDSVPGNTFSGDDVSFDGNRVLFNSQWITAGGTYYDDSTLFVRDFTTSKTRAIPGSSALLIPESGGSRIIQSRGLRLTQNGRYVFFEVFDTETTATLKRYDLTTGTTLSLPGGGRDPHVSRDGSRIVYSAPAPGTTGPEQVWAYDVAGGTTRLVSVATDGVSRGNGSSHASYVTATGRYVLMETAASNLIPGDVNGKTDLVRADLAAVPDVPQSVKAKPTTNGVQVSWTAPTSNGNAAPTSYRVNLSEGGEDDSIDQMATATSSPSTFSGLEAGKAYRFSATAKNGAGFGADSAYTSFLIAPFSTPESFVNRQFRDFRGRDASTDEQATWINGILRHTTDAPALISGLIPGGTLEKGAAPLVRLYRSYFLRSPDSAGMRYWYGRRAAGASLAPISSSFAASSEFRNRYGSLSNKAFVQLVYQNVLGRPPDAGGLAYWTSRLDQRSSTRGAVMASFSESSEHIRTSAGVVDPTVAVWGLLQRMPTASELAAAQGKTRVQVVRTTVTSPSYWAHITSGEG